MNNQPTTVKIRFEDLPLAQAGVKAAQLEQAVRDASPGLETTIERADPANQDFGATLVLILGTPAAVALAREIARGIANYLSRDHSTITIEADGRVVATGVSGNDAARIAEAFASRDA